MMFGRNLVCGFAAMALLSAMSSGLAAQDAPAPAPEAPAPAAPAPAAPAAQQPAVNPNLAVNELFGNWSVRCFNVESQAPCDVIQVGTSAETQQRISLISIAYLPASQTFATQIIVPLGVALSRGLSLQAGEGSLLGVKFNRCELDGCYVEIPMPQGTIDGLRGQTEDTLITVFAYGQGDALEMPFSVDGFSDAIDRMMAEAEDRAVDPLPQ